MSRMESSLEAVAVRERHRHHLRKDMVGDSGASNGSALRFHCMICKRDVSMQSREAREFVRHFAGDHHWSRNVAYRVQHGMPVFDQLKKPLELTSEQSAEYLGQDAVEKDEGFSFPEDLLPACTRVDSTIPLLTMVNCVAELCRWGGSYVLLRKLWGNFRATLGLDNPLYSLRWILPETLVSKFYSDGFVVVSWSACQVVDGE